MHAFIIRPFGERRGIDFDRVERELIAPALANVDAQGGTTAEILEAGSILIDMFQRLLIADLVIADISTNNPNAFYELGIRHALQEKRTFLIRAKTLTPAAISEEARKDFEVPFDLKTDRYLEYDPQRPQDSLSKLTQGLKETIASDRQDSPVFLVLPNLKSPKREQFIPVPLDFGEDVQRAEKQSNAIRLTLLGLEAKGFAWERTALRLVGRALFFINRFEAARSTWESLRDLEALDHEANIRLATVCQRLDDLIGSNQALERAAQTASDRSELAEIHAQLGRNKKDLWIRDWRNQPESEKPRAALSSPLLLEAYQEYLKAYELDLNAYYPGLNVLGLIVVILELAAKAPQAWVPHFQDADEAAGNLKELERKRNHISAALQLRLGKAGRPDASPEDQKDQWLVQSAGDLSLLTLPDPARAIQFYKKASAARGDFILDAARRQLKLFSELGVMGSRVDQALNALPEGKAPAKKDRLERLLLFTGHRVDSASRKTPRFPAAKEGVARDAIRAAIEAQQKITKGRMLGIAGGANGGDILFLEQCQNLGIPTHMMLALPPGPFINASVEADDKTWVTRFQEQLDKQADTPILAKDTELPKWLQAKRQYDLWQRNNLWLLSEALCRAPINMTVIALWDGATGDGPGGTEHMVGLAKHFGAYVMHLNTKTLFNLE